MSRSLVEEFYWSDIEDVMSDRQSAEEKYKKIVRWAGKAKRAKPERF